MKKSIYLLSLIFLAACISSCDTIHFNKFPGTAQDTIPTELRGQYEIVFKKTEKEKADTATLYIGKNSYTKIDDKNVEITFLSDSVVFSTFGKNYFLSKRENVFWTTNQIKLDGKNLIVYLVEVNGKEDSDKLKKLQKYFPDGSLIKMENKKIFLADMNEVKLVKFVSKELKQKGIKLKRVE